MTRLQASRHASATAHGEDPTARPRMPLRATAAALLALTLLVSALAGAAAPLAAAQAAEPTLQQRAAASRVKGAEAAPVLVLEVADFQCPYCARFWREIFPRLDSAFIRPGKVRWVFVNLPLPNHRHAWAAAEAALCAGGLAGDFWAVHDRLFAQQEEWAALPDPAAAFVEFAREIGVSESAFRACTSADLVASIILEDVIFAARSGVRGTPAFLINEDQALMGLKSFEEWEQVLEEALRRAAPPRP